MQCLYINKANVRYTPVSRISGFTLIELIITLLVIAIIVSVSVGALVDTNSRTPRQVMVDIQQLFELARDEAAITGKIKGIFHDSNQLQLRDYARVGSNEVASGESLGGLISSIASAAGDKNQEAGESFNQLEDRGALSTIAEPSWHDPIYTLKLPEEYTLEANTVAALRKFIKEVDLSGLVEKEEEEEELDVPLVRFFPDGSVMPGGKFVLAVGEEQLQLHWDTNGKLSIY